MRYKAIILCYFISVFFSLKSYAKSIFLNKKDATVWLQKQTITGKLSGFYVTKLLVFFNSHISKISVTKDSIFYFDVLLKKGENTIRVKTSGSILKVFSKTVTLSLGFSPTPILKPYAAFEGKKLTLHSKIISNPWQGSLHYFWSDDARNPKRCKIENYNEPISIVHLPSVNGIYYFNLKVSRLGDTAKFQTFVVKEKTKIHVFDLDTEHSAWIDHAVIYEITPSAFVKKGNYDDITVKLPELKQLGINTIWLQPVYSTFKKGQGYDIIDYFSLREDFGNEQQLKNLIRKAKQLQLRILFDFVPNHTSIHHPYAEDCIKYGVNSHYYDFYQHEDDGAPYSSLYKKNKNGFLNYFWEDLVNLNYNNEEVQQWIIEACKYWIKKFDIDGYRFDAAWGINARMPSFWKKLKIELKSIKPDLLLLAEDKGSATKVYKSVYDAVYDWTADTSWISQWSWQYHYSLRESFTVFNYPDVNKRPVMLRQALFNNGDFENLRLRFLENNDLPRFIKHHQIIRTKMAAALLFSLPGIPMLYNGQEIGDTGHPYSRHSIFKADESIQSLDSNHLFAFYRNLIELRKKYAALNSKIIVNINVSPENKMFAFQRRDKGQQLIIIINMDSIPIEATIKVKDISNPHGENGKYTFEDVLHNTTYIDSSKELKVPMESYGVRWLLRKKY